MRSHIAKPSRNVQRSGYASRRFVSRVREIVEEYRERGLKPAGAWAEVLAAVRKMDREGRHD